MATVTGFRTPEEAALELELPLLGNLSAGSDVDGPVAAAWPTGEGMRRDVERICDRLLETPLFAEGSIGVLGDVSAATRAAVSAALAAGIASERTTVLIDADLRAGHLSFDDRRRAQEGLVDVLRYGVRSPRVVSPTLTPGLALLPVGSRTLDLEGTYGAESVPGLFAELSRSGEVLFVNGPGPADVDAAEPLLAHVEGWILLHEIGASDPERTRSLRDRCGRSRCVGVLALIPPASGARAGALTEDEVEEEAPEAVAAPAPSPEPVPAPVAAREETLRAEPPAEPRAAAPLPAEAPVAWKPPAEPEGPEPRSRSRTPWILGGAAVAAVVLAVMFWPRPGAPPEAPPAMTAPPAEPTLDAGTTAVAPAADATAPEGTTPDGTGEVVPPSDPSGGAEPQITAGTTVTEPGPAAGTPVAEPDAPVATDLPRAEDRTPAVAHEAPAPASTPPPSPAAPTAPAGGTVFGVHLESVKSEEGAAKEAAALTAQGTPAFIHRTDIPDKGTWWRVYAGPFATRDEAEQAAARIRAGGREYTQVHRLERGETGR